MTTQSALAELPQDERRIALRRVRLLAGSAALIETTKVLPGIDAFVLVVEWAFLKTIVPGLLEVKDAWGRKIRSPFSLMRAFTAGNWWSLMHRAFPEHANKYLMLDVGTDGVTLALPAPFDLMDLPAAMADASISVAAHKALKQDAKAKAEK
ncbi:MAG: hypothetical protein GY822_13200 [Deltaproteobacteria bacterium]|nr:hypothetical protein [Deltaproteobacteria bacterium]